MGSLFFAERDFQFEGSNGVFANLLANWILPNAACALKKKGNNALNSVFKIRLLTNLISVKLLSPMRKVFYRYHNIHTKHDRHNRPVLKI